MEVRADEQHELAGWLALSSIPGLGGVGQRALLKHFGTPDRVFGASPAERAAVVGRRVADLIAATDTAATVAAALAWCSGGEGRLILTLADARYPLGLLDTPDPPTVLYARGDASLLRTPGLAIVGSRNATAGGLRNAEQFARAVAQAGVTVVSGLALGIDAAAHQGALDGGGATIAVVGTGIDRVYPARNAALAHRIADGGRGLIVSELPLGAPPLAHHFPRRNRIIAGLARGTLVVEAAPESGSLITARLAAESGREVFAIPGSIHAPHSRGCHRLIREGAALVECAADILDEFAASPSRAPAPVAEAGGLLAHLGHDPLTVDELVERSGLTADALLAILFELELGGAVAALPGGRYQRLQ